jgi:hypothetical protein
MVLEKGFYASYVATKILMTFFIDFTGLAGLN